MLYWNTAQATSRLDQRSHLIWSYWTFLFTVQQSLDDFFIILSTNVNPKYHFCSLKTFPFRIPTRVVKITSMRRKKSRIKAAHWKNPTLVKTSVKRKKTKEKNQFAEKFHHPQVCVVRLFLDFSEVLLRWSKVWTHFIIPKDVCLLFSLSNVNPVKNFRSIEFYNVHSINFWNGLKFGHLPLRMCPCFFSTQSFINIKKNYSFNFSAQHWLRHNMCLTEVVTPVLQVKCSNCHSTQLLIFNSIYLSDGQTNQFVAEVFEAIFHLQKQYSTTVRFASFFHQNAINAIWKSTLGTW